MKLKLSLAAMALAALLCFALAAAAQGPPAASKGQTLHLPLVSHVFLGAKSKPYDLTKTFTFRNRDRKNAVTLVSIVYFNGSGEHLGEVLKIPRRIAPMASLQMPIGSPKPDKTKEGSPCLIVRWKADKPVMPPLVQCIMIGASGQQGISFSTTATPVH
jgi:hypothetical protein